MTNTLLTFHELCSFLKADETIVLSLIEAGAIPPPVNIGNRLVRWVHSDLLRWVQTGCPSFPPPTSEELALISAKHVEENRHPPAGTHAGLATDQAAQDS